MCENVFGLVESENLMKPLVCFILILHVLIAKLFRGTLVTKKPTASEVSWEGLRLRHKNTGRLNAIVTFHRDRSILLILSKQEERPGLGYEIILTDQGRI